MTSTAQRYLLGVPADRIVRAPGLLGVPADRIVRASVARGWLGCLALGAVMLAGFAAESEPAVRATALEVTRPGRTGFTLVAPAAHGLAFTNRLTPDRATGNHNLMNGAGVALGDYDRDGKCDVFLCTLEGRSALYRNHGNWRFEDVTERAGVVLTNMAATGAVFADLNGDGAPELVVNACGGPNALFLNDGRGRFTNITAQAGLVSEYGATSLALADVDGNGTVDLYVANYGETSILRTGGAFGFRMVNGKVVVTGKYRNRLRVEGDVLMELGEPDTLALNDGRAKFQTVPWTGGVFVDAAGRPLAAAPWDMGLSVMFRDINGDRAPDLYVCNDFQTPDRFWINDGQGHFGPADPWRVRHTPNFSMTVDFADVNRDGFDDFFVSDMLSRRHDLRMTQMGVTNAPARVIGQMDDVPQHRRNMLCVNRGDGTFADVACLAGLEASDWTWTAAFMDADLDGYEDLFLGTGHAYDTQDLDTIERTAKLGKQSLAESRKNLFLYPPLATPNFLFRNRGDLTFEEVGGAWGFDSRQVTHGLAFGDLDGDGDLDVVLNCLNAPALVYRNDTAAPRLAVRLKGRSPNTEGIGSRIRVLGGAVPMQSQEVMAGGRYLSGDDPMRVFAAGTNGGALTIEVLWRSGARSEVTNARADHLYEVMEPAEKAVNPLMPGSAPWFEDRSERLGHRHHEDPFEDMAVQPLLHRRLSQLGPGAAWMDLDADGHEDLAVGVGRGGALGLYRGNGRGEFAPWKPAAVAGPVPDDLAGLAAYSGSGGVPALLAAVARWELGGTNGRGIYRFEFPAGAEPRASDALAGGFPDSPGPVAVADVDGDGDLDVFVGGRVVPGRYPEPAISRLYLNEQGALGLSPDQPWPGGLVSGAVFTDLDADGFAELALAFEWGPIRVFRNLHGRFRDVTEAMGLGGTAGWWNSIQAGDFDGDGRMDLVAGNWGLNSLDHASPEQPIRVYSGDFDGDGTWDLLEAYSDWETGRVLPRRDLLVVGGAMPFVRAKFQTHGAYAKATAQDVLGEAVNGARELRAATLESMVFLNRGARFEWVRLPREAQFSAVFGLVVADFDGDGAEDVFLAQNFFGVRNEEVRLDAGRGLWLSGDGRGGFRARSGQESGLRIYGEQRGAATADFDEDGRPDLVVTQNGAATRLFRNAGGRPGLRVRLRGPKANPQGIGAVLQLGFGDGFGAARELHGGGGYWSQDALITVLAALRAPREIRVRWPGGRTSLEPVAEGVREIEVKANWD